MDLGTGTLTGITRSEGCCDRCERDLGTIFMVAMPDGTELALGRKCAAKVTGFRPDRVGQAAKAAARVAEVARRQAIVDATYPDAHPEVRTTAAVEDCWWGGRGWAAYDTWQEYVAAKG